MKILVGSDFRWEDGRINLRNRNERYNIQKAVNLNRNKINRVISNIKPDLLVFLGDIISDGCCRLVHDKDFLKILKNRNIKTFLIRGNHDYSPRWETIIQKIRNYKHISNLNEELIEYNSLKFLGIPYQTTRSKIKLREIYKRNFKVDFILAHTETLRRIWLTDIRGKFIVTGHSGTGYFFTPEKNFVILTAGFPYNYTSISILKDKHKMEFYHNQRYYFLVIKNNKIIELGDKGTTYKGDKQISNFYKQYGLIVSNIKKFREGLDRTEGYANIRSDKIREFEGRFNQNLILLYKFELKRKKLEYKYKLLKEKKNLFIEGGILKEELYKLCNGKTKIFKTDIEDYIIKNKPRM